MSHQIRIIGGAFKGRRLQVLDEAGLRPTTDRVRESVFNWLQFSIRELRCLDLFAGTGALGFEALSRGASHVTLVEKNKKVAAQLKANQAVLAADDTVKIINSDALAFIKSYDGPPFDLIFLDPPYQSPLLQRVFNELPQLANLLHSKTVIYAENEKSQQIALPAGWHVFKCSKAGQISYYLCEQDG